MWSDYKTDVNWSKADSSCPSGWHLPTKDEFQALLNAIGTGSQLYNAGWRGSGYWSSTFSRYINGKGGYNYGLDVNSRSASISNYANYGNSSATVRCVSS